MKPYLLLTLLLAGAGAVSAQPSQAKKEIVARLLESQQPGLDAMVRGLVEQPVAVLLQQAGPILRERVPAERRDAAAKAIDASTKKYLDEATPLLRERANRLAPSTVGAALESKLSEDELRQLLAWIESPVNKKYQQLMPAVQAEFSKALAADARPAMDAKLQALERSIGNALGLPADGAASSPRSKPAAKGGSK